jgi:hypothetical protein
MHCLPVDRQGDALPIRRLAHCFDNVRIPNIDELAVAREGVPDLHYLIVKGEAPAIWRPSQFCQTFSWTLDGEHQTPCGCFPDLH